jgi:hypothetical protein
VVVDQQQKLPKLAMGSLYKWLVDKNGHTAEAQKTMLDADSTVVEPPLVAHCSLVEVHILSQPFHLPFGRWLGQLPLTVEVFSNVSDTVRRRDR